MKTSNPNLFDMAEPKSCTKPQNHKSTHQINKVWVEMQNPNLYQSMRTKPMTKQQINSSNQPRMEWKNKTLASLRCSKHILTQINNLFKQNAKNEVKMQNTKLNTKLRSISNTKPPKVLVKMLETNSSIQQQDLHVYMLCEN